MIRNKLKNHRIAAKLRYRICYEFKDNPQNIHVGEISQMAQTLEPINITDTKSIKELCHVLLLWALDGKKHGNGFGFPFDRPHAEFYRRLCLLWEQLSNFQDKCMTNKPLFKCIARIIGDLSPLINDMQCMSAFQGLTKKQKVFGRSIFRYKTPGVHKKNAGCQKGQQQNTAKSYIVAQAKRDDAKVAIFDGQFNNPKGFWKHSNIYFTS